MQTNGLILSEPPRDKKPGKISSQEEEEGKEEEEEKEDEKRELVLRFTEKVQVYCSHLENGSYSSSVLKLLVGKFRPYSRIQQ